MVAGMLAIHFWKNVLQIYGANARHLIFIYIFT